MVPGAKSSPGSWSEVRLAMPQLSSAVGAVQVTSARQTSGSVFCAMSAGIPLMVGSSSSVTVISKVLEVVLPWISVEV